MDQTVEPKKENSDRLNANVVKKNLAQATFTSMKKSVKKGI